MNEMEKLPLVNSYLDHWAERRASQLAMIQHEDGKEITYKRPLHVEIWPIDEEFPLTRSAKVDKIGLYPFAEQAIERLRANGKWDA